VDLARFSKAVLTLADCMAPAELGQTVLRAMKVLCDSDLPAAETFHGARISVHEDEVGIPPVLIDAFNAHVGQHPLIPIIKGQQGAPAAGRWSDFAALRSFKRTALYNEFFRPIAIHRQLACRIELDGGAWMALAFNRTGSDFQSEDVALVDQFLPHVGRLIQRLISRMEVEEMLALSEIAAADEAVMVVDQDCALVFATERARRLARDYFSLHMPDGLPVEIRLWLQSSPLPGKVRTWQRPGGSLSCACSDFVRRERLVYEILPGNTRPLLLRRVRLAERRAEQSTEALQSLGLTPREAEVLYWMTEGKRNGEIAVILNISERTVDKHREHLFTKLGVETRTAAVAAAQSAMCFPS